LAVYFAGSSDNGGFGHTGIVDDDPDYFWSVTFNGVARYNIAWWNANSAAKLGFIDYSRKA
jgi:hypothetical protein